MRKHFRVVHEGDATRFPCTLPLCGKTFGSEWDRKKHVRAVHEKVRVACPYAGCGVSFTAESARSKHVLTAHLGVRVPCAAADLGCTMTFYDRKAMRTHVAHAHAPAASPQELALVWG